MPNRIFITPFVGTGQSGQQVAQRLAGGGAGGHGDVRARAYELGGCGLVGPQPVDPRAGEAEAYGLGDPPRPRRELRVAGGQVFDVGDRPGALTEDREPFGHVAGLRP